MDSKKLLSLFSDLSYDELEINQGLLAVKKYRELGNENSEEILEEAYGIEHAHQGVYLDGIVSRKKQMLPPLIEVTDRRS